MANDLNATAAMLKSILDSPEGIDAISNVMEALGMSGADEESGDAEGLPGGLDMGSINKAMQIAAAYSDISKKPDDRVNLLLAIKPFLRPGRRKGVESAVKLLGLYRLMPLMGEFKDLI